MKIYRVLGGCCNLVHDKEFPINSVVLGLEDGTTFVCTSFKQSRKKPLQVYCYHPLQERWVITFLDRKLKHAMWDYYRAYQRKCHKHKANYAYMMKHDRKQKKRSGTPSSKYAITDYECSKNPFHDFRRSTIVLYN